jgi:hypothetical protein
MTLCGVSFYTLGLFKKREFAGISAGFSFVGAERTARKTKWRWMQSVANSSRPRIPWYQGIVQGNARIESRAELQITLRNRTI